MTGQDAERIARMRAVWQEAVAADFEVTTAQQRYLARKKARPSASRSLWFEFGLGLFAAAVLLVSVRFVDWLSPQTPAGTLSSAVSGQGSSEPAVASLPTSGGTAAGTVSLLEQSIKHAAFSASLERAGEESAVLPGVPYVVAAGESVQVRLGTEVQTVSGPSVLEFHLDPERASGWRLVIAAGNVSDAQLGVIQPKAAGTAPRKSAAQAAASWSEVAEALRAGEQQRAEAALQGLAQGADANTRDSARLALAQLWLSQGRGDEARGVLRSLREAGSTAFIRRRAAELLGSP